MENKKPTIDELLNAATSELPKKRRRIENNSNTLRYIDEMKLEAGPVAVPNYVIYWHYRQVWKGSDRKYKANKIVFFRTFTQKFPSHRIGKQRFYLLKENCIELNDAVLEEAKLYDKKYVRFKEKEETAEGQAEVSSHSPGDETPQD
jgi:hypothetical protein